MELPDFLPRMPIRACATSSRRSASSPAASWASGSPRTASSAAHTADVVDEQVALGDRLLDRRQGLRGDRRVRHGRADQGARPARLRAAVRVRVVQHAASCSTPACALTSPPLRRGPATGRWPRSATATRGWSAWRDGDRRHRRGGRRGRPHRRARTRRDLDPHRAPGGRSPGHDDLDRVLGQVADAGLPVVLHVGGHPLQLDPAFMNTGRPVPGRLARRRRERPRQGHDRRCTTRPSCSSGRWSSTACSSGTAACASASSSSAPAGCRRCCAASTRSPASGAVRSPS